MPSTPGDFEGSRETSNSATETLERSKFCRKASRSSSSSSSGHPEPTAEEVIGEHCWLNETAKEEFEENGLILAGICQRVPPVYESRNLKIGYSVSDSLPGVLGI